MSEDTRESKDQLVEQTSPDLGPAIEEAGEFLDDWSVAEDLTDTDTTSSVRYRDQPAHSADDVHRNPWPDIDDVVETASSVILEMLDLELSEAGEARDLEDETLSDLQQALSPEAPQRFASDPEPPLDTEEISIVGDPADDEDPFDVTGIELVDIDTGEVVDSADIPVLETGFHLIEEKPESLETIEAASHRLALRLTGASENIKLDAPWGALLSELRGEILNEKDIRVRASYLFVLGQMLRALGADIGLREKGSLAATSGAMTRSDLLVRLATRWVDADDEFFQLISRLESLDDSDEGSIAGVRRSSIAAERLLDGELGPEARTRLRELLIPPETFTSLVVKAVDGHATNNRTDAVSAWERLGRYAKGSLSGASIAIAGWSVQGSQGFFEVANRLLEQGWNSRALLLLLQREAVRAGDRLEEARALKRLVGLDVNLGKRLPDEGRSRSRLKAETSARLVRLSLLLDGLSDSQIEGTELKGMEPYRVMRDAISLNASDLSYLRRLARLSHRHDDAAMTEKALVSLAALTEEPNVRAVIWERVADLARRAGQPASVVEEHLERSLAAAPDCLPALISMGQHLISVGAFDRMLDLRGTPTNEKGRDVNLAWRRAELLERTRGASSEILSLYRDAREDHPASVHLFFCVERALARVGDWRGLRTLYDSASAPESGLRRSLESARFDLASYRLGVEVFLENAYGDLTDRMLSFIDRSSGGATDDDTAEMGIDENMLWRVIAREMETDPGRTLGRLEVLLQRSKHTGAPWRLRTLVWYAHMLERVLDQPDRARQAHREILASADGAFLQRWAVRGLLRSDDAAWVAESLASADDAQWMQGGDDGTDRQRLAAELLSQSGQSDRSLDVLEKIASNDPVVHAEIAERATVTAIRSRQWVRAIPWTFRCFPSEAKPALAEIARHLGASSDDEVEALRYIDAAKTKTPVDPYVILCELELAYRAREWKRALDLVQTGLGTIAAGSIAFRAFLLEQAVMIAEWGTNSNERALTFLEDLWSLDATVGSSPIFAASAFLRVYSRMKRDGDQSEHAEYVRTNFTPSVAEALLAEPRIYEESEDGAAAAQWYADRLDTVPAPLQPYYRWMSAALGWMFGDRERRAVQDLADATASGDPTHRVGPFLLAIAYRHADMYASCERQLNVLRTPGNSRPVQDWVIVRQLFHLAVTQNQTSEALEMLRQDEAFAQFAWYGIAEELFARATRDPTAIQALTERAKVSGGARSLRLEIAEIENDMGVRLELAADELPEAIAQTEMFAARGDDIPMQRWDIGARHAELLHALKSNTDDLRYKIVDYFRDVDEELLGSPWCPLRAVRGDLSQFGFDLEALEKLQARFLSYSSGDMGSEARLLAARQFLRLGERDAALDLMPGEMGSQLVSVAWALFNFALDPFTQEPRCVDWALELWERRRQTDQGTLAAELEYELGRCLESIGRPADAIEAMRRALSASPRFLPAQVAAGRLLIGADDWRGLAALWESEMQFTEDVEAMAGVAFRIGYLWERRLAELPDAARNAEEAYRRVLRVRPNHYPTLHALLGLAYRRGDWTGAEDYIVSIVDSCPDEPLRVSYLCELGGIREQHLEDPAGAREAYRIAFDLDADSVEALFGVLRTDDEHDDELAMIEARLRQGVTKRELRDLANHLFGITRTDERADALLADAMPTHYAWHVSRLVRAAEAGKFAGEAAEQLKTYHPDQSTVYLVDAFERVLSPRRSRSAPELTKAVKSYGASPMAEGRLVAAMHDAGKLGDLELLGTLAAVRARRVSNESLKAAELTWLAVTLMLRKEWDEALDIAQQLLEQMPQFVPAIKAAKFAAEHAEDYEAVVRWYLRDAATTRVPEIASRNRLYASEVQRKNLGDFDAALGQLRHVLEKEPAHSEAFGKLRDILLTKRDHSALLDAYERRLEHTESRDGKSDLLNEMADIALNHLRDRKAGISYLSRSLEIRPKQPRRLRVLSELYEAEQQWDRAVVCHRATAELIEDPIFLGRLWRHVGHLYETKLKLPKKARNAYARALKLDPESTEILTVLARVCERLNAFDDAIALLEKVKVVSRDPKVLLDARIGVARLRNKTKAPASQIVDALRDVLVHHPGHPKTVETARQVLGRAGAADGVNEWFQSVTHDIILEHGTRGLGPGFEMARQLGHNDRAFCIACIGDELGVASPKMVEFRRELTIQRHWPRQALPPELTAGILPDGLVGPFVELLRLSGDAVSEGIDAMPGTEFIKKGTRLKEPSNKATQLAFQWPELLGLELRDVHIAEGVPGGSCVIIDGGVRLALDERWLKVKDPTELLVGLGARLAGWSMGIGPWAVLDIDTQKSLFISMVAHYVRGWAQAERSHLPSGLNYGRIQRWLERKGQRVAPYAMEISGRFASPAIRKQLELLNYSQRRIACLLIDDPGKALRAAGLLQKPEPGVRPPWAFILQTPAARVRRAVGVSPV